MLDGMGTLAENRDIIAAAEANKRLALQRDRIIRNIWQAIAGAVSFVVIWWLDVHVNDGMMFGGRVRGDESHCGPLRVRCGRLGRRGCLRDPSSRTDDPGVTSADEQQRMG